MQFRAVAWTRLAVGLVLALGAAVVVAAAAPEAEDRAVFAPTPELYRDGWIDFKKNGVTGMDSGGWRRTGWTRCA